MFDLIIDLNNTDTKYKDSIGKTNIISWIMKTGIKLSASAYLYTRLKIITGIVQINTNKDQSP